MQRNMLLRSVAVASVFVCHLGLPFSCLANDVQTREAKFYDSVGKNDLVTAKSLLEGGVDPNARPPGKQLNQTPLEVAVSNNWGSMTELLFQFKADPLVEDDNGDTAFVYASDFPQMMDLFRKRGLSINTRNSKGITPLLRMMSYTTKDRVANVLKAGADPDLADADGETPLMNCADDKDLEVFRLILPKTNVNAQNSNGETALMKAADAASPTVLKMLLDAHADTEKMDSDGRTVLAQSVGRADPAIAFLLLERGAKVNVSDSEGITPLMMAYNPKLVSKLIALGASAKATAKDGRTALHFAAGRVPYYFASGDQKYTQYQDTNQVIQALIKSGADINARDADGQTALHVAAKGGAAPTIKMLLEAGADINAVDANGRSPLDLAVESTESGKVALLLKLGANPKPRADSNPAYEAALAGQVDILRLLLKVGAAETKEERGHLLEAATSGFQTNYNPKGRLECIRELMKAPLEVNVRDGSQMTPLMWAAAGDISEAVEEILKSRGDISAKDSTGRDALSWAAASGAVHTIPILLEHGAPINGTDTQKHSALDWAKLCGQEKVVPLLQTPGPR